MKEHYKAFWVATIAFVCSSVITGSLIRFSPPSKAGAHISSSIAPAYYSDPNLIEYWPTIDELQWFAETNRDGKFRKLSQDDYEAKRAVWYGDKSAAKYHRNNLLDVAQ